MTLLFVFPSDLHLLLTQKQFMFVDINKLNKYSHACYLNLLLAQHPYNYFLNPKKFHI